MIAEPLTTGDQYDTGRALVQAIQYGRSCAARQTALIDAVDTREQIANSIKEQLK